MQGSRGEVTSSSAARARPGQIDFAVYGDALAFAKAHPDKKLALIGMTCAEAASHLSGGQLMPGDHRGDL